jgi:hypothetical protein
MGRGMREFKDSVTGKDDDTPRIEEHRVEEPGRVETKTVSTAVPAEDDPARTPGTAKPADVS